jgi:hypothetical protein
MINWNFIRGEVTPKSRTLPPQKSAAAAASPETGILTQIKISLAHPRHLPKERRNLSAVTMESQ